MFSLEVRRKYGGNANMDMSGKLKLETEATALDVRNVPKKNERTPLPKNEPPLGGSEPPIAEK